MNKDKLSRLTSSFDSSEGVKGVVNLRASLPGLVSFRREFNIFGLARLSETFWPKFLSDIQTIHRAKRRLISCAQNGKHKTSRFRREPSNQQAREI